MSDDDRKVANPLPSPGVSKGSATKPPSDADRKVQKSVPKPALGPEKQTLAPSDAERLARYEDESLLMIIWCHHREIERCRADEEWYREDIRLLYAELGRRAGVRDG